MDKDAWDELVLTTVALSYRPLQCKEVALLICQNMSHPMFGRAATTAKVAYHMNRLRKAGRVRSRMIGLGPKNRFLGYHMGGTVKVWCMTNAPMSTIQRLRLYAERYAHLPPLDRGPKRAVPRTDDMRQMLDDLSLFA